jgi:hypothetical protein
MKLKSVFLSLMLLTNLAFAEDPNAMFDTSNNIVDLSKVKWIQVNDIQRKCDSESKKRGLGGFNVAVDACAFWQAGIFSDQCLIITKTKTSMAILGHEMRHCFQGAFHK